MAQSKVNYGYDGNPVLMIVSIIVIFILESILFIIPGKPYGIIGFILLPPAMLWFALVLRLLLYIKIGKFRQRDAILSKISWKGNEMVLDIGTGRGLLMIGAAKRLTEGKSIGIDIWRHEDMVNNSLDMTMRNVELEGVAGKVEIKSEDIRKTSFESDTFDVILSNLCLHNISDKKDRNGAIREIYRILKPGGTAVIGDLFFRIKEYSDIFREEGMTVDISTVKGYGTQTIPILVAVRKF